MACSCEPCLLHVRWNVIADPFPFFDMASRDSYCDDEVNRLEAFLSLLPPECAIPVFFAAQSDLPDSRLWEQFLRPKVDMVARQHSSIIGSVHFAHLKGNDRATDLIDILTGVARAGVRDPGLFSSSFFELWLATFGDSFESVILHMDAELNNPALQYGSDALLSAFEMVSVLFNSTLETIGSLISSDDLRALAFPAAEFVADVGSGALPRIGWNATGALGSKRERLAELKMPPIHASLRAAMDSGASVAAGKKLFLDYVDRLAEAVLEPVLGEDTTGLFFAEVHGGLCNNSYKRVAFATLISSVTKFICLAIESALREIVGDFGATCICLRRAMDHEAQTFRALAAHRFATWQASFFASSWSTPELEGTFQAGRLIKGTPTRKRRGDGDMELSLASKRNRISQSHDAQPSPLSDLVERIARASQNVQLSLDAMATDQ